MDNSVRASYFAIAQVLRDSNNTGTKVMLAWPMLNSAQVVYVKPNMVSAPLALSEDLELFCLSLFISRTKNTRNAHQI